MAVIKFKFLKDDEAKNLPPKPQDKFILDWTKALGWKANPFDPKVNFPEKLIAGYDKERTKINLFVIKKYDFGIVEGEEGKGKTTLLKWMTNELKKYGSQIYASYIPGKDLTGIHSSIKLIIWPTLGPHEKYITKPYTKLNLENTVEFLKKRLRGKPLLLIIDDISEISDVASVLVKKLFTSGLQVQLIISGTDKELSKSSFLDLNSKEKLHIVLRDLTLDEVKQMVARRIESVGGQGLFPFNDNDLEKLFNKAKKNPAKFLELCYNGAAEYAVDAWQNEQEKLKLVQEKLKVEQIEIVKEQKKLDVEEKDFLEEIKKAQKEGNVKVEAKIKDKKKASDEKKKELEVQKKELDVTANEIKNDIESLKKDGFREKDLGGDIEARKRRLDSEKKLSSLFGQIKQNLKDAYKGEDRKSKDDEEDGLF